MQSYANTGAGDKNRYSVATAIGSRQLIRKADFDCRCIESNTTRNRVDADFRFGSASSLMVGQSASSRA
jgi:hypothetical protein